MHLLWSFPSGAMVAGGLMTFVLRGLANATTALRLGLDRFNEVQLAVAEVRSADATARAATRGLTRA
jgi:hypothetical protein